ncbi:MAG: hypothetical protein JW909_07035 [Planctomycetes bacterium]|nr:hypothetical protein [Planctomycetota bacterium]
MIPIRKVILYKHGVGYFEREGEVDGEAGIDLHFKAGEMNDVLKSLTVFDLGGGVISSISYESTKPIEKQLEDLAIRLPDHQALTGLLDQVKGARAAIEIGGDRIEGVIGGIETVQVKCGDDVVTRSMVTMLVAGASLQTFDLLQVKSISLLDENLRSDLQYLLDTLISAKKKDAKKLTIYARGEGRRTIAASYIVETPVWKTSYRVIIPDSDDKKNKLTLQGWALVDNTQDEDWEDVSLSLVAGLPVSFIHDLYSPRYKRRPVVAVREEEAYGPPVLEEGVPATEEEELYEEDYSDMRMAKKARREVDAEALMSGAPARSMAEARLSSVEVQTRTVEVGDLFQYSIENLVTVKRNQSALVPILQADTEGRRVAVYNPEIRNKNPMSSLLVKNSTGMTLEGGPVMVIEKDTYVGEAMLDTLKPSEERIVPYSVELGCVITSESDSLLKDVRMARLVDGYLYLYRYRVNRVTYHVNNKSERPIDLFLEHRFINGWDLLDDSKLHEKTDNFFRFRLDAPAKKLTKFVVEERGDESESHWVQDADKDMVNFWMSHNYINKEIKASLLQIAKLNRLATDLESRISETETLVSEIFENQERLRENLKALGDTHEETQLKERYVRELGAEEDRLAELRDRIASMKEERRELAEKVADMIRDLRFETELK